MSVCIGKRKYGSQVEADRAAIRRPVPLRAYPCPKGPHWHLTSEVALPMTKAQKRARRSGRKNIKWKAKRLKA